MRVIVEIPDSLSRKLKSRATRQKRSVNDLILQCMEDSLDRREKKLKGRVSPPLIRSKRPGSLRLNNAIIFKAIPFP